MGTFKLSSAYTLSGDQPKAVDQLVRWLQEGRRDQVLLGITGSGKTFTMANVIAQLQRPTLIMAHNKTLAAQLYEEFKDFFPENAVEYFVSYYDYYQPEAYVPRTDTFIEKDASINDQIDRMRHSATRALFERRDVIIVASVSCIYGIGDPESYSSMIIPIAKGDTVEREPLIKRLIELQYSRNDLSLTRGTFRARGDVLELFPSHLEDVAWRISLFDDDVERLQSFDPLTGKVLGDMESLVVYPNSHYVVPKPQMAKAADAIKHELQQRLKEFGPDKLLEAQRLRERTLFDLEMIQATGFCSGIENYSRHLSGRLPGQPPPTLFDYFPADGLLFMDESHVSVPQIAGMGKGDRARKQTLVDFGFRLPSALDNRPLSFEEWDVRRPQTVFVSATPAKLEMERSKGAVVEQIIRPTGLLDPVVEVRPVEGQVDDLMADIAATVAKGERVLVTTLTKKMSEQLTDYLQEAGIRVAYIHSDVDTLERTDLLRDLRLGVYDVLVGINLLREGIDLPEVSLVAILDADKEGFLRSTTSLIQTIGRAARHQAGRAVLYADVMTNSLKAAVGETARRRTLQTAHNTANGITPTTVQKAVRQHLEQAADDGTEKKGKAPRRKVAAALPDTDDVAALRKDMLKAAEELDFERAAALRDRIRALESQELGLPAVRPVRR